MGEEVTVVLSEGCSGEDHVLVVVQEVGSGNETRPLATYSVEELMELTREYSAQQQRRQVSQTTIYIAAQLTRGTLHIVLSVSIPITVFCHSQTPVLHSGWATMRIVVATLITL